MSQLPNVSVRTLPKYLIYTKPNMTKFLLDTNTVLIWILDKLTGTDFLAIKNDLLHNKYFNATVDSVHHAGTDTYRKKLVPSADDQKILEREKLKPSFQGKRRRHE